MDSWMVRAGETRMSNLHSSGGSSKLGIVSSSLLPSLANLEMLNENAILMNSRDDLVSFSILVGQCIRD